MPAEDQRAKKENALSQLYGYELFCLSGFLITDILIAARDSSEDRGRNLMIFYGRRFLRIFPIYYLTLGVAVAVGYEPVVANLGRLASYTIGIPGLPPTGPLGSASHLWSLSVEEQFYCFWPPLIFFFPRKRLMPMALVMVVACFLSKLILLGNGAAYGVLFRPLTGCLDSLGMGAIAAILRRDSPDFSEQIMSGIFNFSVGVLGVLAVARIALSFDPWYGGYVSFGLLEFFLSAILFMVIIVYVTQRPETQAARFLGLPVMRSIARVSYGLYLYHFFAPAILRWVSIQWLLAGHKFSMSQSTYAMGFVCSTIALSFLMAFASWRYIEEPLLRLKDRLDYAKDWPFETHLQINIVPISAIEWRTLVIPQNFRGLNLPRICLQRCF